MSLEILHVGFNQDFTCFVCGTSSGFRVYGSQPLQEKFRREAEQGGLQNVQLLYRCNIIALVGSSSNPKYPDNKVIIWDDHSQRNVGEINFRSQVKSVKMRRDKVIVALEHKVYAYNFANLKLVAQFETQFNPLGILEVSQESETTIIACPGLHAGQIRIENFERRSLQYINAHTSALASICLSTNGKILATTSGKGTLIRIWDTETGEKLQEFRRGTEHAFVFSIAISPQADYITLLSDKGTLHIFSLNEKVRKLFEQPLPQSTNTEENGSRPEGSTQQDSPREDTEVNQNLSKSFLSEARTQSSNLLKSISKAIPWHLAPEYSFAKVDLPKGVPAVVGFSPQPHVVIALSKNGTLYQVKFDPATQNKVYKQTKDTFLDISDPSKVPFESPVFTEAAKQELQDQQATSNLDKV